MNIVEIIEKKAKGKRLTRKEIEFFVDGYTKGIIPDYQASSLLMAIKLKGMDLIETADLTRAMLHSGDVNNLSYIKAPTVDKHSTGGVGDKTSLVLGPLVASCGLVMAKMSGRGLGHTGGTIDKLESIPGFNTQLTDEQFRRQVKEIGIAIVGQTAELVPADKKLYALRDVTGTVDSMPLICSSIISKKVASGSKIIELDVKYGSGAFMKTKAQAKNLANLMIMVGKMLNRKVRAVISNMNEPLGNAIGNSLEVIESIETLKGHGPKDLTDLCVNICAEFLVEANMTKTHEEALKIAKDNLYSGKALEKFKEFVAHQGGNPDVVDNYKLFKQPKYKFEVYATRSGKVSKVVALDIGHGSMYLGGGRMTKDDIIDMSAGIILNKKSGDYVKQGELLCTCYTDIENVSEDTKNLILHAFKIDNG